MQAVTHPDLKDEMQDYYFSLFDIAARVHLMKDEGNPLMGELKPLLDDALTTISEVMARLDETDEPLDTKTSWWLPSGHWLLGRKIPMT